MFASLGVKKEDTVFAVAGQKCPFEVAFIIITVGTERIQGMTANKMLFEAQIHTRNARSSRKEQTMKTCSTNIQRA